MSKIVIIGGHGKVALLAAPLLVAEGNDVTSIIRNPEQADDVEKTGAHALVADVQEKSTTELVELFTGTDTIIWSAGAGGGSPERTYAVDRDAAIRTMEAAEHAGAHRYIMVSYEGARPDHGVSPDNGFFAYAESKAAADAYLRTTSLDWTILGPSGLTLEEPTERIAVTGRGTEPTDGKHVVSRANVARVIVAALADASTLHRKIDFSDGPEPIAEAIQPAD